jgi:hypothetical protein
MHKEHNYFGQKSYNRNIIKTSNIKVISKLKYYEMKLIIRIENIKSLRYFK